MQTVPAGFTAVEDSSTRKIAQNVQVAWKKDFVSTIRFFTIGVSTIGGNDLIPGPTSFSSAWNKYLSYQDESDNVLSISYERELNWPLAGLVQAQADVTLDNTSRRYTPSYAGGRSEIFTAILPKRPIVINAGFNVGGIDQTIPQFVGLTDRQVEVDISRGTAKLHAVDFVNYLKNKIIDHTEMFTATRSDIVIGNILAQAGFSTSQYDLDPGINIIGFGLFDTGTKMGDIIDQISKAEFAHFQQIQGYASYEARPSLYPH